MKNKKMIFGIVLLVVFTFSMASCSGGGGGKTLNSPEALKEYLDKQPANSPDKPIKVSMGANEQMLPKIAETIDSSGKYVSLNITGSALTTITDFLNWKMLVSITIPASVTSIDDGAFFDYTSLASVTVDSSNPNYASEGGILYNKAKTEIISVPPKKTVVTIPNSVTSIKKGAFQGCTSLASVTIPNGVTSIGAWAFYKCTSLANITFQGTITSDGFNSYAFYDLGNLYAKYLAGGIGTYTTTAPVGINSVWSKQ